MRTHKHTLGGDCAAGVMRSPCWLWLFGSCCLGSKGAPGVQLAFDDDDDAHTSGSVKIAGMLSADASVETITAIY
jgi:hypothetical protein